VSACETAYGTPSAVIYLDGLCVVPGENRIIISIIIFFVENIFLSNVLYKYIY